MFLVGFRCFFVFFWFFLLGFFRVFRVFFRFLIQNYHFFTKKPNTKPLRIVSSPYLSTVATRSEDSNTLTHMLPTTGIPYKCRPPNWGTAQGGPPKLHNTIKPKGYHKFSSPMTRYVDQMHHTNKLFKLH